MSAKIRLFAGTCQEYFFAQLKVPDEKLQEMEKKLILLVLEFFLVAS